MAALLGRSRGPTRWLRDHPTAADALLAAGVALALVAVLTILPAARRGSGQLAWELGGALLGCVPIVFRRRWLWPAIGGAALFSALSIVNHQLWQSQPLTTMILSYTAASRLPVRRALVAVVVVWVPASLAVMTFPHSSTPLMLLGVLVDALFATVCFVLGRFTNTRHAYTAALEARAVEAERNQRTLAAQAVGDERRRIARELHDVVAHHVSVMGVLATGARRALTRDPAAADEALATIERTGRTTLREMRRLLAVLRSDDEDGTEADLVPQPGLSALRGLLDRIREAGLPVETRVDGDPYPIDPGIALTVYRLVQEALTNALRHAGPASAQLRLGFRPDALTVEVFDTGRGPAAATPTGGHGLVGMRERVALYGGELRTGPRPGGGFRVYARIPMDNLDGMHRSPAAELPADLPFQATDSPPSDGAADRQTVDTDRGNG